MIILIENALGSHRTWICIKVLGDNPIFLITKKKSDKYFQLNSNIMQQQLLSAGKVQIFWEGPKTLKILLWRYYLIFKFLWHSQNFWTLLIRHNHPSYFSPKKSRSCMHTLEKYDEPRIRTTVDWLLDMTKYREIRHSQI